MRIGIDARELSGHPTGVGRYLSGLLTEWVADARHEFILFAPTPLDLPAGAPSRTVVIGGRPGTWWEQVSLPAAIASHPVDVLFSPAYSAPLRAGVPVVVAMHDLSFMACPQWFTTREGMRRRWLARRSAEVAAAIITISRFSEREIVTRLGVAGTRVHVVPPGVTPPEGARSSPDTRLDPTVLYVGSVFNRRHVPDLIRAFGPIARAHARARLDIVGDNRTYPRQNLVRVIGDEGLSGQVSWRAYAPETALGDLFTHARAFAFLSEYEGLGLTPLEALAVGVPPVLIDTPVAREACGAAALYVPVGDNNATTAALTSLLFDDSCRARVLAAAPAALARYSWAVAARDTLVVLENAAR